MPGAISGEKRGSKLNFWAGEKQGRGFIETKKGGKTHGELQMHDRRKVIKVGPSITASEGGVHFTQEKLGVGGGREERRGNEGQPSVRVTSAALG